MPEVLSRVLAMLVLFCGTSFASSLFDEDTVLEISLTGPLQTVLADTEERRERPFLLSFGDSSLNVDVRLRGKSRVELCRFRPLNLDFDKAQTTGTVFDGQNRLKLVTHCKSAAIYDRNVVEEYAAYRILNLLTDVSFRTRLLRITYDDTDDPGSHPLVRHGILIESPKALSERLHGETLRLPHITANFLDKPHAALVFVFQYMIGNTDWSHVRHIDDDDCCHNGILLSAAGRNYFVPYDFDMSGLVNARYARPHPDLGTKSVRTRRYRGYCTSPDILRDALRTVSSRRDDIDRLVEALPAASAKETRSGSKYLQRFFTLASKEEKLLRHFERRCLD